MKKNSITEFELEQQDSKLRLKRGLNGGSPVVQDVDAVPAISLPMSVPVISAPVAATVVNTGEIDIKSPMIGTFYRSPSPESAAYIDIGTEVNSETVVAIIEAMKVMSEIKAE